MEKGEEANGEYMIKGYSIESPVHKKKSSLDDFLEKQLERFRETTEKNPDLTQDTWVGFKVEIIYLIDRFLFEAKNRHVKDSVCELVSHCLLGYPMCFETREDKSIKIYNPEQFYTRLRSKTWLTALSVRTHSKEIGFNGFNIDAKKFIRDAYEIIYNAYLKEYAEKDRKTRKDPWCIFPENKLISR